MVHGRAGDLTDAHSAAVQIGDLEPLLLRQKPRVDLTNLESVQRGA